MAMGKNYTEALIKSIEMFMRKEIAVMIDKMVEKGVILEDEGKELYAELNSPEVSFKRKEDLTFLLSQDNGT